ncbi:MAG: YraN family protein [Bryobacteraceae bacterium]
MLGWLYRCADTFRHRARMRTWDPDLAQGRRGEDVAHRYLTRLGYHVVARNYRTPGGWAEADLVAWDGPTLVFVEVKSRQTEEFGSPDRAIDPTKRRKIAAAARDYVRRAGLEQTPLRFDVVSIVWSAAEPVTHLPGAFLPPQPGVMGSRSPLSNRAGA